MGIPCGRRVYRWIGYGSMIAFVILFGAIAVIGLITAVAGFFWDDSIALFSVGTGMLMLGTLLAIAAANTEEPDCSKVYNPDGSYVETCEYPGDE